MPSPTLHGKLFGVFYAGLSMAATAEGGDICKSSTRRVHDAQVSELLAQQPRAELPTGARGLPNGDAFWLAHYHALERHVRKNKLKATLTDQLGRPQVCCVLLQLLVCLHQPCRYVQKYSSNAM